MDFKVGDRIRKKDGTKFSNGEYVVTIGDIQESVRKDCVKLCIAGLQTHIYPEHVVKVDCTVMLYKQDYEVELKNGCSFRTANNRLYFVVSDGSQYYLVDTEVMIIVGMYGSLEELKEQVLSNDVIIEFNEEVFHGNKKQ